jgi:Response regulators consisting of a CheY-like receiver domain and a winged-helix DNA-binding domain
MRILLLEDNATMAESISSELSKLGYLVDVATTVSQTHRALMSNNIDVGVFDISLIHESIGTLIREVRARGFNTPIIVLTTWEDIETKFDILFEGASDYVVKPFEIRELESRIQVQYQKLQHALNSQIACGKLEIDLATNQCRYDNKDVGLTRLEWRVLKQLALNVGKVVSKEQLENACYGWHNDNESNSVEVHLHYLRKKLSPDLIKTVRGFGYILKEVPHS